MENTQEPRFPRFETRPIEVDGITARDYRAIVREGDSAEIANVVSPRYQLVQHEDIWRRLMDAIGYIPPSTLGEAKIKTIFPKGGQVMVADVMLPKLNAEPQKGDIVTFGVRFVNSVDGSTGVAVMPYTLRLVCTNGMTHSEYSGSIRMKHTSGSLERLVGVEQHIQRTLANFGKIAAQYETWTATPIKWAEAKVKLETSKVALPQKLWDELDRENPENKWEMFNVLTWYNSHRSRTKEETGRINFSARIPQLVALA